MKFLGYFILIIHILSIIIIPVLIFILPIDYLYYLLLFLILILLSQAIFRGCLVSMIEKKLLNDVAIINLFPNYGYNRKIIIMLVSNIFIFIVLLRMLYNL